MRSETVADGPAMVPVDSLLRVCNLLNSTRRLPDLLRLILGESTRLCACRAASIFLRDGDVLRPVVSQCESTYTPGLIGSVEAVFASYSLPIDSGSIAGYCAHAREIVNVPDAYAIEPGKSYGFNTEVDRQTGFRTQSILALPLVNAEQDLVGVLELINREDATGGVAAFDVSDVQLARVFSAQVATAISNAQWQIRVQQAHFDTVLCVGRAAEYRDPETYHHLLRISEYCTLLGRALGLPAAEVELLRLASPLHDTGKVGVADAVLKKPGRLTPEEFRAMQRHTVYGARILSGVRSPLIEMASVIALSHHERVDGTGYPQHRRGDRIPLVAGITAAADVLDALTTERCYKPAWSWEEAADYIRAGSGEHFLPDVVEAFSREESNLRRAWQALQRPRFEPGMSEHDDAGDAGVRRAVRKVGGARGLQDLLSSSLATLADCGLPDTDEIEEAVTCT